MISAPLPSLPHFVKLAATQQNKRKINTFFSPDQHYFKGERPGLPKEGNLQNIILSSEIQGSFKGSEVVGQF